MNNLTQYSKINDVLSAALSINLSIVQGSGIGPTLYVLMESDLHPLSLFNVLVKFADDTNLIVPEHTDCELTVEFEHIRQWSADNNMVINLDKTKEIVFQRPHPSKFDMPEELDSIDRVRVAKLLGVIIPFNFNFDEHVSYILSICSQRLYLLKLLRSQGLPSKQLSEVFVAIVLSRLTYALSAWGGFVNQSQKTRINVFLRRARRFGFVSLDYDICELLATADFKLFKNIVNHNHCLYHLLPPLHNNFKVLRPRGHKYQLPNCRYKLFKDSYLPRCLYQFRF